MVCVEVERVNDEETEGGEDTPTGGADNVEHTVAVPAVVKQGVIFLVASSGPTMTSQNFL